MAVFLPLWVCVKSIEVLVSLRRSPAVYVVTTGMLRQQYDTSAVVSARAHGSCSFTRLIFYGLSLLVRTRNALQNELTINGTRAVLSARALLLDVIFLETVTSILPAG